MKKTCNLRGKSLAFHLISSLEILIICYQVTKIYGLVLNNSHKIYHDWALHVYDILLLYFWRKYILMSNKTLL